jgi:hypothetical protein
MGNAGNFLLFIHKSVVYKTKYHLLAKLVIEAVYNVATWAFILGGEVKGAANVIILCPFYSLIRPVAAGSVNTGCTTQKCKYLVEGQSAFQVKPSIADTGCYALFGCPQDSLIVISVLIRYISKLGRSGGRLRTVIGTPQESDGLCSGYAV